MRPLMGTAGSPEGSRTGSRKSVAAGRQASVGWQAPSPQPRSRIELSLTTPGAADTAAAGRSAGGTSTSSSIITEGVTGDGAGSDDDANDDDADEDEPRPVNPHESSTEGPVDAASTGRAVSRETAASRPVESTVTSAVPDTPLAARIADEQRRRSIAQGTAVPRPPAPRVMTIANQKGGVGKTTTTVNVAAALAQSGLNVLVIDIDPQGNASTALGIPHHAEVPSIYDVITDDRPLAEVLQECPDIPGLWCAPATIDLAGAEIELVSLVARESRLKRAVDEHLSTMSDETRFDYVLIDCPPSLGLLTVNAFVAAAEVFIPIQCEYYALEGLSQLLNNIGMIRRHLNPHLEVSTILLTMYDGRTNLSSNVADEVRSHFPDNVLRTQIPRSVRISEAPSYGQTVLTYDPSSSGALSYLEAAKELALRSAPVATTGASAT